jgi:hypothetical protein
MLLTNKSENIGCICVTPVPKWFVHVLFVCYDRYIYCDNLIAACTSKEIPHPVPFHWLRKLFQKRWCFKPPIRPDIWLLGRSIVQSIQEVNVSAVTKASNFSCFAVRRNYSWLLKTVLVHIQSHLFTFAKLKQQHSCRINFCPSECNDSVHKCCTEIGHLSSRLILQSIEQNGRNTYQYAIVYAGSKHTFQIQTLILLVYSVCCSL